MTALRPPLLGAVLLTLGTLAYAFHLAVADAALRVRGVICRNASCTDRAVIALEPARIDVEAFVPLHAENRRLQLGIVCDGEPMLSELTLDGQSDPPLFTRTYREVWAGVCVPVVQVVRVSGHAEQARSEALLIRSSF